MSNLERLQTPDPRSLAFLPGGLGLGLQMSGEAAADYWCGVAHRCALHVDVAEQTRRVFADLVAVQPYGVLRYEIFTLVHDRALFVLEQALRDGLAQVESLPKAGYLDALLQRARQCGLLEGQRSKAAEEAIRRLRNAVAHPEGYHLLMPPIAALGLSDLAEIINHLWGHQTPGGRLYPAPLTRQTVALAWNEATSTSAASLAENLTDPVGWDEFTRFAIVQAEWPAEPDLHGYDSWFETTTLPVDYRWGPGSREDALSWLNLHPPAADTIDMLGRHFLVRFTSHRLWWPMRIDAASALPAERQRGRWFLVGADTPQQAFAHVRAVLSDETACTEDRQCPGCGATNVDHGSLRAILARSGLQAAREQLPRIRLPGLTGGDPAAGVPIPGG